MFEENLGDWAGKDDEVARGRTVVIGVAAVLVAACSSNREAGPIQRPEAATTEAEVSETTEETSSTTASSDATTTSSATSTTSTSSTSSTSATRDVTGTTVAGAAGGVEPGGPPFPQTDPFSEARKPGRRS